MSFLAYSFELARRLRAAASLFVVEEIHLRRGGRDDAVAMLAWSMSSRTSAATT